MHVDVIDSFGDLSKLKEDWDHLYRRDPDAHYFLSWNWIARWFDRPIRWFVLAAKEDPEDQSYVAFFPIQLRTRFVQGEGFLNSVAMGGSYFAPYTGILCDPAYQGRVMPAFAACLRRFNWANLHLDDIYISPERLELFLKQFSSSDFVREKVARPVHISGSGENIDHDIYVYVKLPDDFESFLANQVGSKTRHHLRKALRTLDEPDGLRVTHATEQTIERDLEAFYRLWGTQWIPNQEKYGRSILDSCRHMLLSCFRDGSLFVPVLWHGDIPVGIQIIFMDRPRDRLICFLGGRDLGFKRPQPGLLLHAYIMRWGIENGYRIYDLGTGDFSYKFSFGSDHHRVERLRISTRTGRNLGERLDPHTIADVFHNAVRFRESGDLASAEIACRQILAGEPKHAGAQFLFRQIKAVEAAAVSGKDELDLLDTAFTHHRAGRLEEAEKDYRSLLAVSPVHFEAAHQLGVALLQRGEVKAAEVELRRALEIRPDAASAHCNYGNAMAAMKEFEKAIASFDRAIALEPRHAIAFNNRGNVLRGLGRLSEALASYERALALQPNYAQASKNREAVLKAMGMDTAMPLEA
ncbi:MULTISPECIES: GNAT family N-acetyltransferase [unclassified Sinorhizobium]|uniref:GNAT family N-acetyltransferase n=1 Tax=unclassified Sinorhizobium TaxID=2613772 RepID=UPI0035249AAF